MKNHPDKGGDPEKVSLMVSTTFLHFHYTMHAVRIPCYYGPCFAVI
jgi:hypothetical protein